MVRRSALMPSTCPTAMTCWNPWEKSLQTSEEDCELHSKRVERLRITLQTSRELTNYTPNECGGMWIALETSIKIPQSSAAEVRTTRGPLLGGQTDLIEEFKNRWILHSFRVYFSSNFFTHSGCFFRRKGLCSSYSTLRAHSRPETTALKSSPLVSSVFSHLLHSIRVYF